MSTTHPTSGFMYLIKGFKYLVTPGIKRFVIIPAIINIILFSLFLVTGFYFIGHFSALLPTWLRWIRWLFYILFFLTSSIVIAYTFTIFSNLIGAPFNSLLSEKVELLQTGKRFESEEQGFRDFIHDMPRTFKREWDKIKYYIPRAIILVILFLIPFVNLVASILWFIFGCWMMSIEYVDFPLDNHRTSFKDLHQFLRKHCLSSLSFGLAVALAAMIPVVNFLVMPAAVIGGTLMWLDLKE